MTPTFWRHNQTSSFACPTVHHFHYVYKLLLVVHSPVDLVIVASTQINHDVLVTEEEHDGARIVQLVHGVEIRNLCQVH